MSLGHEGGFEVIEYVGEDDEIPISVDSQGLWLVEEPLPDNTGEWWIFWKSSLPTPERQLKLTPAWANETSPPWRRGFGFAWRAGEVTHTFGLWWKGKAPRMGDEAVPKKVKIRKLRKWTGVRI